MKGKIIFSVILTILWVMSPMIYGYIQGPIDASIAANQAQDSVVAFGAASAVTKGMINTLINMLFFGLLVVTWLKTIVKFFTKSDTGKVLCLALFPLLLISCFGPYQKEVYVEIATNETAFLVPLEGKSLEGQQKFMSIDYLNDPKVKVPTKRILIPTKKRELGRGWADYEYIPTMKVIVVNRTPVSREWTKRPETGTSNKVQAIGVESKDSINFWAGVTTTAYVSEDDAAKFLYFFAGKPLEEVMDQNIRPFIGSILATEFGAKDLNECRSSKGEIFVKAKKDSVEHFKAQGITITNLGSSEGLDYEKKEIQNAIDANFVAEMSKTKAQHEKDAQDIINKKEVAIATAKRQAAEEFAKAEKAQTQMIQLEIEKIKAQAMMVMAEKIDQVKFPNIIPQGTNFFMGLDTATTKK